MTDTTHRVGVFGWVTDTGGVNHFRVLEPLRVLEDLGVNVISGRLMTDDILSQVDTVLVHTPHGASDVEALEKLACLDTHRIVVDIDDWMWGPDYKPFKEHYTDDVLYRLYRAVQYAHVVTTPSPRIAEYLSRLNPNVHVVPNTVPAWVLGHAMPIREAPTLGWQTSSSHANDWTAPTCTGVVKFLNDHPDWHVAMYGPAPARLAGLADRPGVKCVPWVRSMDVYYRNISMDVGIGPLRDTPFNRAKSALRAVDYAALGVVAVLPDLDPYRGWVEDGITGRLVTSGKSLRGVLNEVADGPTRWQLAQNARKWAAQWTTEYNIQRWVDAWQTA